MKKLIFLFLLLPNLLSANELGNILRQIVIGHIAQKSPEAGRILQAAVPPKPNVYVSHDTTIGIGQHGEQNSSPYNQVYPEPQTARDYIVYGKLLGNAGKVEEAAQYFLIARNMEPDNPEARYGLALSLALMGQKDQAEAEYRALQKLTEQLIVKTNKIAHILTRE